MEGKERGKREKDGREDVTEIVFFFFFQLNELNVCVQVCTRANGPLFMSQSLKLCV